MVCEEYQSWLQKCDQKLPFTSGKRFNSRVEAIRTMLISKKVNDKMDVNFLKNGFLADRWIRHSLLPDNWFAKTVDNEGGLGTGLKFVTNTNQVIWRKMNTLKYMESHDFDDNQMYNMNQFFIFNLYLDDRGKEKIKKSD